MGSSARIVNNGTWNDQTTSGVVTNELGGGVSTFTNSANYVRSGSDTTVMQANVRFDNTGSGQVQVQNGNLALGGGGTSAASWTIAVGTTLDFLDAYSLNAGTAVSGPGMLRVSGGTLNLNTALTTDTRVHLIGGVLSLAAPLTLNGAFDWSGGNVFGPGTLVTNATSTISGTGLLSNGEWQNFGNATMTGNSRIVVARSLPFGTTSIINRAGATFVDASTHPTPLVYSGTGLGATFVNEGTFTKAAASLSTQTIDVPFFNSQTVNVEAGRLQLDNSASTGTGGSGSVSSGAFVIADVATLALTGGTHHFTATAAVSGAGTFQMAAGRLNAAADLTLSSPFTWSGGTIAGAGALPGPTARVRLPAPPPLLDKVWNNFGALTIRDSGALALAGDGTVPVALNNRIGGVLASRRTRRHRSSPTRPRPTRDWRTKERSSSTRQMRCSRYPRRTPERSTSTRASSR